MPLWKCHGRSFLRELSLTIQAPHDIRFTSNMTDNTSNKPKHMRSPLPASAVKGAPTPSSFPKARVARDLLKRSARQAQKARSWLSPPVIRKDVAVAQLLDKDVNRRTPPHLRGEGLVPLKSHGLWSWVLRSSIAPSRGLCRATSPDPPPRPLVGYVDGEWEFGELSGWVRCDAPVPLYSEPFDLWRMKPLYPRRVRKAESPWHRALRRVPPRPRRGPVPKEVDPNRAWYASAPSASRGGQPTSVESLVLQGWRDAQFRSGRKPKNPMTASSRRAFCALVRGREGLFLSGLHGQIAKARCYETWPDKGEFLDRAWADAATVSHVTFQQRRGGNVVIHQGGGHSLLCGFGESPRDRQVRFLALLTRLTVDASVVVTPEVVAFTTAWVPAHMLDMYLAIMKSPEECYEMCLAASPDPDMRGWVARMFLDANSVDILFTNLAIRMSLEENTEFVYAPVPYAKRWEWWRAIVRLPYFRGFLLLGHRRAIPFAMLLRRECTWEDVQEAYQVVNDPKMETWFNDYLANDPVPADEIKTQGSQPSKEEQREETLRKAAEFLSDQLEGEESGTEFAEFGAAEPPMAREAAAPAPPPPIPRVARKLDFLPQLSMETDPMLLATSAVQAVWNSLRKGMRKEEWPDFSAQDMVLLVQLLTSDTIKQALFALVGLLVSPTFQGWKLSYAKIHQFYRYYFPENTAEEVVGQSESGVGMVSSGVKAALHSPVSKQIAGLIATMGAMLSFSDDLAVKEFLSKTSTHLQKAAVCTTAIEQITSLIAFWEKCVENYRESGNIMDLFGRSREETIMREADKLIEKFKGMRTGEIGSASAELQGLISKGREFVFSSLKSPLPPLVTDKLRTLGDHCSAAAAAFMQQRTEPIGLLITGPPGTGKTWMVQRIHAGLKAGANVPKGCSVMHTWQAGKHQNLPPLVDLVVMNDVATTKDEMCPEGQNFVTLLQTLIDIAPMYTEGAEILQKNNGYLAPSVVAATTNATGYLASTQTSGAGKLDRRLFVIATVWTEWAIAEARRSAIDVAAFFMKSPPEIKAQCVQYTVGTMKNTAEDGSSSNFISFAIHHVIIPPTTDVNVVLRWIMAQERLRANRAPVPSQYCTECRVPVGGCVCGGAGDVVLQGSEMSAPFSWTVKHEIPMSQATLTKLERLTAAAVVMAGVLTMMASVRMVLEIVKVVYGVTTQGTVSSVSNLPAEMTVPAFVAGYTSTEAAWLGAADVLPVGLAVWQSGASQHFVAATHNLMFLTKHFFDGRKAGDVFYLRRGDSAETCVYDPLMVIQVAEDTAILYVPSSRLLVHTAFERLHDEPTTPREPVLLKGRAVTMKPGPGLGYDAPFTIAGDCGNPLVGASGMFYGIHYGFGSVSGTRFASPISKSQVQTAIKHFAKLSYHIDVYSNRLPESLIGQAKACTPGPHPMSDLAWFLKLEPGRAAMSDNYPIMHRPLREAESFNVRKTLLEPTFGPLCPPHRAPYGGKAVLHADGVYYGPHVRAFRNMAVVTRLDHPSMRLALQDLLGGISVPDRPLEPYSDQQAICGDAASVLLNPRDNDKAMGPSLALIGVTKANGFVRSPDGTWVMHQKLVAAVQAMQAHLESEDPLELSISRGSIKNEAYPEEKVLDHKGRLIYVQDWCLNHEMRRYILPLMSHLMMNPLESGVNVVMNAAGPQWEEMATYLCGEKLDRPVFSGDQSAYDLRHCVTITYYVSFMVQLAARCGYSQRDQRMVRRILNKATRHIVLLEGNWVLRNSTLGSGRSDTIVFNCIMLMLMVFYTSRRVYPTTNARLVVRAVATGDDSLVVAMAGWDMFDGAALAAHFAEGGYEMTDSRKNAVIQKENILHTQFLKRGFRWQVLSNGLRVLMAPLSVVSIYRSLTYVADVRLDDEPARNLATAASALREMFMHGEEAYEQLCTLMRTSLGGTLKIPTYAELEQAYLNGTLGSWVPPRVEGAPYEAPKEDVCFQGGRLDQPGPVASPGTAAVRKRGRMDSPVTQPTPLLGKSGAGRTPFAASTTTINSTSETVVPSTNEPVQELRLTDTEIVSRSPASHSLRQRPEGVELAEFFARPRRVAAYSAGSSVVINVANIWRAIPAVASIVDQYSLWRGDPVVTIVWTGSSTFMGMVRVAATPYIAGSLHGTYEGYRAVHTWDPVSIHFAQSSQLPHCDFDLSEPKSHTFRLPFPAPRDYNFNNSIDWKLHQEPIIPLTLASGLTPPLMDLTYYVHYENVVLERLVPQGGGEAPEGHLQRLLAYARAVVARLPSKWTSPVELSMQIGAALAHLQGWARPVIAPQDMMVCKTFGNPAYASGQPDFGHSLALNPSVVRNVAAGVIPLSEPGETQFASIAGRSAQLTTLWASGYAINCTPGAVPQTGDYVWPTPLAYASFGFERWAGSLTYCVQVYSSPLVRWRIGVNIVPPGSAVPASYVSNGSMLGVIIDVIGSTCTDIVVPYLHSAPWRLVAIDSVIASTTTETRLVWYPLMDSAGPAVTPVLPTVILWVKAGPDYSVGIPSLASIEQLTLQGGPDGVGANSIDTYGEVVDDLLLLTRRSCVTRVWLPGITTNTIVVPLLGLEPGCPGLPGLPALPGIRVSGWSFRLWLQAAFLGNTGGHSLKIGITDLTAAGEGVIVTTGYVNPTGQELIAYPGLVWSTVNTTTRGATPYDRHSEVTEVVCPDRNTCRWRYARGDFQPGSPAECLILSQKSVFLVSTEVTLWDAGADDYRVGGFLCAPRLRYRTVTAAFALEALPPLGGGRESETPREPDWFGETTPEITTPGGGV